MKELKKRLKKHLDVLCSQIGERHLGSEGEKRAAEYIKKEFKSFGYDVLEEKFDAPGWRYGKYSLRVVETGQFLPCFPCYYSNSCDVEGELVTIESKNLQNLNLKGKICFAPGKTEVGVVEGRNKLAEKLDRMGALALIIVSNYQDAVNTKIVRTPELERLAVIVVSGDTALEIGRNIKHHFRIKVEAKNFSTQGSNVVARVKGRINKKIVIGAHYDTAPGISGAGDNASGTVALLELARLLKNKTRDYSIDFVAFDGEEYGGKGCGLGSYEYVKCHKSELKNILWMCNIDDLGNLLGKEVVYVGRSQRLKKMIKKVVSSYDIITEDFSGTSDDKIFDEYGIPTMYFGNNSPYKQIHSPNDSLERIDLNKLSNTCKAMFKVIVEILKTYKN